MVNIVGTWPLSPDNTYSIKMSENNSDSFVCFVELSAHIFPNVSKNVQTSENQISEVMARFIWPPVAITSWRESARESVNETETLPHIGWQKLPRSNTTCVLLWFCSRDDILCTELPTAWWVRGTHSPSIPSPLPHTRPGATQVGLLWSKNQQTETDRLFPFKKKNFMDDPLSHISLHKCVCVCVCVCALIQADRELRKKKMCVYVCVLGVSEQSDPEKCWTINVTRHLLFPLFSPQPSIHCFSSLVLCFTPSLPCPPSADPVLLSMFTASILIRRFFFHIKTHRATPWPSDSHHQKTHLCRCRYTHLDLQTGLTQCFHSHPHGVRRRWDAISCITVTVEMQSRHHHFLSLSLCPVFDRLRC